MPFSEYSDPQRILNQGPHQGRGAFTELSTNPDVPANIRAIARKFMQEQDARAVQDEGSTSYGNVENATQYAQQIAAMISALPPEQRSQIDNLSQLPSEERAALRFGQALSGQTAEQANKAYETSQKLLDRLVDNGLEADTAVKLQQGLLQSRGDALSAVTEDFHKLTQAVASKLITPEQVRAMGEAYGNEVDSLIQEGKDLTSEFAPRVKALTQQMEAEIPAIRDIAGQAKDLGTFNQEKFDRRFQPAFERLKDQYDLRMQDLRETLNARGIPPGSEQEAYQTMLLERDFQKETNRLMLEAQAAAEGQEQSEYMTKLQAGLTPFEALRSAQEATLNEQEGRLRLHAARGEDVAQKGEQYDRGRDELTTKQNIAASGVDAKAQTYDRRKSEMEQANQRFGATYGTAVGELSVPQAERLNIASGAASGNVGARLGYSAEQNKTATARTMASRQQPFNLAGAGLGAGGSIIGGLAAGGFFSDPDMKENIEDIPQDGEGFLGLLRRVKMKGWNYKGDPTPHVGPMSTEVPEEMATPDRKGIDVINTLGILEGAVKELDAKIRRMGGGFQSLKEVV